MTAHERAIEKLNEALDYLDAGKPGPALHWANHAALLADEAGASELRLWCIGTCQVAEARMRGQGTLPLEVGA